MGFPFVSLGSKVAYTGERVKVAYFLEPPDSHCDCIPQPGTPNPNVTLSVAAVSDPSSAVVLQPPMFINEYVPQYNVFLVST